MLVVWNEGLATGNGEIDNQHKELFKRFNNLQSAFKQGKALDELSGLLAYLGEYVRSHFALEEQLQIDHEYPGYQKHKEEHNNFIRNFKKLENQLKAKGTTTDLFNQTNMTLVDWLIRHFNWTDKDLAKFLHTATTKQS